MAAKTVALLKGEGSAFWFNNGLYEVKVSSAESGGAVTVVELTVPPGFGPPLHTHNAAESAYVLEGKVRFHLGDETLDAGPGSFVHIPEGTWEQPEVLEDSRILLTYTPGGMDEFFAEVGVPATAHELPPPGAAPLDVERLTGAAARHGLQLQLPES